MASPLRRWEPLGAPTEVAKGHPDKVGGTGATGTGFL